MNKTADLAYWIVERYSIKLRREAGLPPREWSANPIMREVRWCNVHREDDKVTQWLAKNWRPKHHAVWEIVLARMINYIPSLECLLLAISYPSDVVIERCTTCLKNVRAAGNKVFTSAYTISTCGRRMDKIDYVMAVVQATREREYAKLIGFNPGPVTLAAFHSSLTCVSGLGSFLAAQVVADLKNTTGHYLQSASDWWSWSAPGPGSLKGLSAYFGMPVTAASYWNAIHMAWDEVSPLLPSYIPPIHMQDFQNCLCEFSKYMRVKEGNGHVRNKYHPG